MRTSLYDLSVPTFLQTVRAVGGFLERAATHFSNPGVDPDRLPRTAAGIGIGSTVEDVRAAYPDVQYTSIGGVAMDGPTEEQPFGTYATMINGVHVAFEVSLDTGTTINGVWVSVNSVRPPYEYCG